MWRGTSISIACTDIDDWLCPREALEANIFGGTAWLTEDLADWRETLALAEASDDPGTVFKTRGQINLRDPVDGNNWLSWGRWVERRVAEAVTHPGTTHPELDSIEIQPWRLSDDGLPALTATAVPLARQRWPYAAGGFTDFFGLESRMSPGLAQQCMLTAHPPEWRTALARECEDLLLLDDETLRATVVELGSAVVPAAFRLRLWLAWMAWRIHQFEWS